MVIEPTPEEAALAVLLEGTEPVPSYRAETLPANASTSGDGPAQASTGAAPGKVSTPTGETGLDARPATEDGDPWFESLSKTPPPKVSTTSGDGPAQASTGAAPGKVSTPATTLPALGRFSDDPDHKPRPRQWLLTDANGNGFIPAGEVGLLVAAGGVGKTMALIQLAATVGGTGLDWLGRFKLADRIGGGPAFGRVLLAMGEEDFNELDRRRYRFLNGVSRGNPQRFGDLVRPYASAVIPYPLAGVQCSLTEAAELRGPGRLRGPEGPSDWSAAFRDMLTEDAQRLNAENPGSGDWRLIILDPATRFMGPDGETDNKAATEWIREVSRLTQLPGNPAVLVAHHKNKSATTAGSQEQTGARGSSALTDGARFQLDLARGALDGELILALSKGNYGRGAGRLSLLWDDDGFLRPMTDDERTQREDEAADREALAKKQKIKRDGEAKTRADAAEEAKTKTATMVCMAFDGLHFTERVAPPKPPPKPRKPKKGGGSKGADKAAGDDETEGDDVYFRE